MRIGIVLGLGIGLGCSDDSSTRRSSTNCDTSALLGEGVEFYQAQLKQVGEDQARLDLLTFLQSHADVTSAELAEDGFSIWVVPACGRTGVIIPYDSIPDWTSDTGTADCVTDSPVRQQSLDAIGFRSATVLDFTDHEAEGSLFSDWQVARESVLAQLLGIGITPTIKTLPDLTVADLVDVASSGLVLLVGHGGLHGGRASIIAPIDWSSATAAADKEGFAHEDCGEDCDLVEVAWAQSNAEYRHTVVTDRLFEDYLPAMLDSLVIFMHGFSAHEEASTADIFVSRGTHTFVGQSGAGSAPNLPLAVESMISHMVGSGWDAEGALDNAVPEERAGSDSCTVAARRDGGRALAFVSYVTLAFENVPSDAEAVSVTVTSASDKSDVVATFELFPTGDVVTLASATEERRFLGTIVGGENDGTMAEVSAAVEEESELVTLSFTLSCGDYVDHGMEWSAGEWFTLDSESVPVNGVLRVVVNHLCSSSMVLRASYADGALKFPGDQACPESTSGAANYIPGDADAFPSNCVEGQDVNCVYTHCSATEMAPQPESPQPNPPGEDSPAAVQLTEDDLSEGLVTVCFHISAGVEPPLCVSEMAQNPCGVVEGECLCVSGPAVVLNSSQLSPHGTTVRCGAARNFVIEGRVEKGGIE